MSRPTSKKESKELLKFFNSLTPRTNQEEQSWELLASCAVVYVIGMTFIFYKLLGY